MTLKAILVILSVGFAGSFSILSTSSKTGDNICCIKDEWEGLMYLDYGIVFIDQNTAYSYINGSVRAAYSFTKKKVYFSLKGVEQSPLIPKPMNYDTIMLYDFAMGTMYTVQGGECQKSGLDQNMTRQCIPGNAQLLSSGVIGSSTKEVDTYRFLTGSDLTWQITAVVAKNELSPTSTLECDPLHVTYFVGSANPDSGSLYTLEIMDIGPLKSTHVFDVPDSCKHL